MKKNALQKVLAIVLAGAMVMGAAACGDTTTSTSTSTKTSTETSTSTSTSTDETSTVAGIEGWVPFEETVTLTIPIYQRATPNGCANAADNYYTKWVQENFGDKYNINVVYRALTRGDENTEYALIYADSNEHVSCAFEYDYPDVALYYNEGYYDAYDPEWFKQIAPTYWQQMVDNGLDQYTDINGECIFLIGQRPDGNTNFQFVTFYRLDWVQAAGYDELPTDPEDLLDCYAKITELGLGGDHILGGTKTGTSNGVDQNYNYRTYPQDALTKAQQGDYNLPALTLDAQKKLLQWNNTLYNLGYIDDEYNLRDSSYASADFINGDTLSYSCYATKTVDVLDQFYAQNPDAKLAIAYNHGPETYSDGTCSAFRPNGIFGQYIGFSSQASDDEKTAFAMYLEWMIQDDVLYTLQNGVEGVDEAEMGHNKNVDMWCLVTATVESASVEDTIDLYCPEGYPDSADFREQMIKNYEGQVACYNAGMVAIDPRYTVTIDSVNEYSDTLCAKYAELRDKIVMGSTADFEANYAAACEEYLAAGFQKVLDERTQAYNDGNCQ